ncbi:6976_t:CDS:2 [Funneliformis geosporum]|nr:6976_t:CDS:2 [Funneliformis geosporum]
METLMCHFLIALLITVEREYNKNGDYLSGERVYYVAALNINPASKRRAHHLSTEARRRIPAENDMMLNSTIEYVTLWIN